jgi:hypothetical protein
MKGKDRQTEAVVDFFGNKAVIFFSFHVKWQFGGKKYKNKYNISPPLRFACRKSVSFCFQHLEKTSGIGFVIFYAKASICGFRTLSNLVREKPCLNLCVFPFWL